MEKVIKIGLPVRERESVVPLGGNVHRTAAIHLVVFFIRIVCVNHVW